MTATGPSTVCFRYTVKCDHAAHERLKRAARRAGLPEGVLAQRFFDLFVEASCREDFFAPDALAALMTAARTTHADDAALMREQIHAAKSNAAEMTARIERVHAHLAALPKDRNGRTLFVLAHEAELLGLKKTQLRAAIDRLQIDRRVVRVSSMGLNPPGRGGVLIEVMP